MGRTQSVHIAADTLQADIIPSQSGAVWLSFGQRAPIPLYKLEESEVTAAASSRLTDAQIDEIERRQKAREVEQLEELRRRVAESSIPLPSDLRQHVINLFSSYMRDIMRSHKGYRLAKKRDSYRISLDILRRSLRSLLDMISRFEAEALAEGSSLFSPIGADRLGEIELDIQKELFTCTNAAVSLVEFARPLSKRVSLPDYDAKRRECFGSDGLHDLVVSLRILLHHLHIVDASWNLTSDYRSGTKTASFVLDKEALGRILTDKKNKGKLTREQYAGATGYIATQPPSIDLRQIFSDYAARVDRFNSWLTSELDSESIVALRDYDSIIKEKVLTDRRTMYHALLGNWLNWQRPPDPHNHLNRYLTAEQLESVYKLPRNSREQVDLVISYADQEGVVDALLREKIYELFRRSESTPPRVSD
jgi:hypothetical protein